MDAEKRMRLIRTIEKMERNPAFSEKLGIRNKSALRTAQERKERERS